MLLPLTRSTRYPSGNATRNANKPVRLIGVINRGRKPHLLGTHAEIIPHHGFNLRLDGFRPHAQGKFRSGKPEHTEQPVGLVRV